MTEREPLQPNDISDSNFRLSYINDQLKTFNETDELSNGYLSSISNHYRNVFRHDASGVDEPALTIQVTDGPEGTRVINRLQMWQDEKTGLAHRDHDRPAVVIDTPSGHIEWYVNNGRLGRDNPDLPSIVKYDLAFNQSERLPQYDYDQMRSAQRAVYSVFAHDGQIRRIEDHEIPDPHQHRELFEYHPNGNLAHYRLIMSDPVQIWEVETHRDPDGNLIKMREHDSTARPAEYQWDFSVEREQSTYTQQDQDQNMMMPFSPEAINL
jgi:hypothetical protein